jgi:hypothetical protein
MTAMPPLAISPRRSTALAAALLLLPACAHLEVAGSRGGDGVTLKNGADVLMGAAMTSTRPAVVDMDRLRATTTEWQTIQRENVPRGSARYQLLMDSMRKSLQRRIRLAAVANNIDLVVRAGDIADDQGLRVVDLTAAVLEQQP